MKPVEPGSESIKIIRAHSRKKKGVEFNNTFKIAEVNTLLRTSSHYSRWKDICQNNATIAEELADIILKRNDLQEKAETGQTVDYSHLDWLTDQIQHNGIFMLKSQELIKQGILQASSSAKKLAEPVADFSPTPIIPSSETRKDTQPDIIQFPAHHSSSDSLELTEDNFLIFDMQYSRKTLNQGIIGYGNQDKVLLALNEITNTLDFNIDVDPANGQANGWFVSEDSKFELDVPSSKLIINGEKHSLSDNQIEVGKNDIYVDSRALAEWFPVDFNIGFSDLTIDINPREQLPFQEKLDRELKREKLAMQKSNLPRLPRAETEYHLFSMPFVDINLGSSFTNINQEPEVGSQYSIISKGDLANMSSSLYLSGDNRDSLSYLRFLMEKTDLEHGLLGGFRASRFSFGDINPALFPIHNNYPIERGVTLQKGDIERSIVFDTTNFQGNLQPGWEVEVYHNERLIASKMVREDGLYRFDEVPVYYGKNNFKLVFYGPQGQKQEKTKLITVGNEMMQKGKDGYEFSISQQGTKLVEVNQEDDDGSGDDSARLIANYEYGLLNNLSLSTGLSSFEIDKNRHSYLNLGIKGMAGRIAAKADIVHDLEDGDAFRMVTQTGLGPLSIRAEHEMFSDFIDENTAGSNDPMKSTTDVTARGFIPESKLFSQTQYGFSYNNINRENLHYSNFGVDLYLSKNLRKIYFSNDLHAKKSNHEQSSDPTVKGSFRAIGNFNSNYIRGTLNYDILPETSLTSFDLLNRWQIKRDLSMNVKFLKNLHGERNSEGSLSMHWDTGKYLLTPRLSYNSDGVFTAFLGLDFSIGQEPRTGRFELSSKPLADSGAVSAFVFNDKNANQMFDYGDEPLKDVEITAIQAGKSSKTDDNGIAFVTGLAKYKTTDVDIKSDTLEDPFWVPSFKGSSITPPPGNVHLFDFPVITTGEVDGTIYVVNREGKKTRLKNAEIQLLDEFGKEIQTIKSEFDGFYLFMKVPPGVYTVRVNPDNLRARGLQSTLAEKVEIGPEGTVLNGLDIVLGSPAILKKIEAIESDKRLEPGIARIKPPPPIKKSIEIYDENGWVAPGAEVPKVVAEIPEIAAGIQKTVTEKPEVVIHAPEIVTEVQPAAELPKEETITKLEKKSRYGIHLTSYRSMEKAVAGINYLQEKYRNILAKTDFAVKRIDLGPEKGIWFRVIAGSFSNRKNADALAGKLKLQKPYTNVISIRNNKKIGLHLTSYRTAEKAAAGVNWLQNRLKGVFDDADFHIKKVFLGPQKGTWYRVIAGSFTGKEEANRLCDRIKPTQPWCKGYPVENKFRFGIHMESYRTSERAAKGIQLLMRKYKKLLGEADFIIKRVDLGPEKGTWFRVIVGSFDNKEKANTLAKRLKLVEPYCMTCRVESEQQYGIHLASCRTDKKAQAGLVVLQDKYKDLIKDAFYIRQVNLGSKKGIWYRIIAGSFDKKADAEKIMQQIKTRGEKAAVVNFK